MQSVTLSGNIYHHYINGVLIDTGHHVFNTDTSASEGIIAIATQLNLRESALNTAAVLVYDEALNLTNRLQVEQYLQNTYLDSINTSTSKAIGNNIFFGTSSRDTLNGGMGNDTIAGNGGVDSLTGGTDADIFDYNYSSDSGVGMGNRDIITDFETGEDQINTSDFISFTLVSSNATAGNGLSDLTASGAAEIAWEQTDGSTIIYLDTNGDGIANNEIELLGNINLQHIDFVL